MRSMLAVVLLLYAGAAIAQAPAISDADLDAAVAECAPHRQGPLSEGLYFQAGWEHCSVVWTERNARATARAALPPGMSKSVADKLGKK